MLASKAFGPPIGGAERVIARLAVGPWGKFEEELSIFPRQGLKFQPVSCPFEGPHVLQMQASKAFGPPKGGRRRVIARWSGGGNLVVLVGIP